MYLSVWTSLLGLAVLTALLSPVECAAKDRNLLMYQLSDPPFSIAVRPDGPNRDSRPLLVNITLSPITIREVNPTEMSVTLEAYMRMSWHDNRLRFPRRNSEDMIRMDVSKLWTPDIELFQTNKPMTFLTRQNLALVNYDGDILWIPHVAMTVFCAPLRHNRIALNCSLSLGSWTYSGEQIDLGGPVSMETSSYVENHSWRAENFAGRRVEKYYTCCPEPYITSVFSFTLRPRN